MYIEKVLFEESTPTSMNIHMPLKILIFYYQFLLDVQIILLAKAF